MGYNNKVISDAIVEQLYQNYLSVPQETPQMAEQHRKRIQRQIENAAAKRHDAPEVDAFFEGGKRIYLDIEPEADNKKSPTQRDVEEYLQGRVFMHMQTTDDAGYVHYDQGYVSSPALAGMNYTVTDYTKGYATDATGKQTYKIGRLLKDDPTLLQAFTDDMTRMMDCGKLMMVISRDTNDIANMSANRKWHSCTSPDGIHPRSIAQDIRNGALIAYLVRKSDPDIKNPLARALLKPYFKMDEITRRVSEKKTQLFDFNRQAAVMVNQDFPEGLNHRNFPKMSVLVKTAVLDMNADVIAALTSLLPKDKKPSEVYFVPAPIYGLKSREFQQMVDGVADKLNLGKNGDFYAAPRSYSDGLPKHVSQHGKQKGYYL